MVNKHQPVTFETAIKELEQLINQIENNDVDLEGALNNYKQGMELVKFCQDKLKDVEQKIKILDQESNSLKEYLSE